MGDPLGTPHFRAGKLDAYAADQALYQYSRSAKELWRFCNPTPVEIAARSVLDQPAIDWRERGAVRRP
jgi:hypothetical protein